MQASLAAQLADAIELGCTAAGMRRGDASASLHKNMTTCNLTLLVQQTHRCRQDIQTFGSRL